MRAVDQLLCDSFGLSVLVAKWLTAPNIMSSQWQCPEAGEDRFLLVSLSISDRIIFPKSLFQTSSLPETCPPSNPVTGKKRMKYPDLLKPVMELRVGYIFHTQTTKGSVSNAEEVNDCCIGKLQWLAHVALQLLGCNWEISCQSN